MTRRNPVWIPKAAIVFIGRVSCLSFFFLASCDPPPGDVGPSDQMTQTIVSTEPKWKDSEAWAIKLTPEVRVGAEEDGRTFSKAQAVYFLGNGGFLATNMNHPPEFRAYSTTGQLQWAAGREGEGPAEFRAISRAWPIEGGRILAWDPWSGRMSTWSGNGDFLEVIVQAPREVQKYYLLGPTVDGAFFAVSNERTPYTTTTEEGQSSTPIMTMSRELNILDTLAVVPYADYIPGAHGFAETHLFPMVAAFGTDGNHVFYSFADSFQITEFSGTGEKIAVFSVVRPQRRVTDAMIKELKAQRLAALRGPEADRMRPGVERRFADPRHTGFLPSYDRILVDAVGNIWASVFAAPTDTLASWDVFDTERRFLGTVTVPKELTIKSIGDDRLLGVWKDEFEVETVAVHRIVKREPPN